ncbi:TPA: hypothetical protein ACQGUY_000590 [Pseudomonas aeruginosa]|uniref:hypothetical protein n=1 Tax=Pseudomonas aeruginosa group TaxID=136841 RepID=UPI001E501DFA|nr:hypothetical protein [Pseudomonas aeruginosa]MCF1246685.1 hypothetical protein [Pseudomonas aeruginosa]MCT5910045.1 hypothetical protein [Pseudomonas aeruginosa]MDI4198840.1 hypothetical protein [Pseudomonas aeruginosa]MEE1705996.1 hypothetical protein [Pseudomonas aeruginosa]MEE1710487.1 hypothetical protein [Pseudomonas aeruginosa]
MPLATLHQELTSAPAASWVVPLEPLHQELTSAPAASWVVPLEPLHQELTSAPTASWVVPLATLRQDQASAPSTSWVVPLAPLHQEPTSAPVASWVVPLEPLHQELTSAPVAAINFSHPIGTEKMCDSIVYAPMDELEFERLLGLATLFNDNDEWPIDFTELQELSELLGKLKSCVDVAIDNAPEGAKS